MNLQRDLLNTAVQCSTKWVEIVLPHLHPHWLTTGM